MIKDIIGKKVWISQFDDEKTSAYGYVYDVSDGFISLRLGDETSPGIWINLSNVKEIELFRESNSDNVRMLRVVKDNQDTES